MDKTRVGCWSVAVLVLAQTLSTLLSGGPPELRFTGVAFNAVAAFSTFLLLRRPDRNRWPLVAWAAGFFGWHVTGLLSLAGVVTTGLDPVFSLGVAPQLSVLYQAVLATLAGFAVHLLLPRPPRPKER